jgi:hypothetical protein
MLALKAHHRPLQAAYAVMWHSQILRVLEDHESGRNDFGKLGVALELQTDKSQVDV